MCFPSSIIRPVSYRARGTGCNRGQHPSVFASGRLPLQTSARRELDGIAIQVELQESGRIVALSSLPRHSDAFKAERTKSSRSTKASTTRTGLSLATESSRQGGKGPSYRARHRQQAPHASLRSNRNTIIGVLEQPGSNADSSNDQIFIPSSVVQGWLRHRPALEQGLRR